MAYRQKADSLLKRAEKLIESRTLQQHLDNEKNRMKNGDERIAIVVGAGGSKPYGYPTGDELVNLIREKLNDDTFCKKINKFYDDELIRSFGTKLRTETILNIDKFLRNNTEDIQNIGRFMISYILTNVIPTVDKNNDWYAEVADLLVKNVNSVEEIYSKDLYFITFNYDHVIEWRMNEVLRQMTRFDFGDKLHEWLRTRVIHLYGELSNFDMRNSTIIQVSDSDVVDFSYKKQHNLKTIYQHKSEQNEKKIKELPIRSYISNIDKLYIVGFGFDSDNSELIGLTKISEREKFKPLQINCFDYKGMCKSAFNAYKKIWNKSELVEFDINYSRNDNISKTFKHEFISQV